MLTLCQHIHDIVNKVATLLEKGMSTMGTTQK